MAFHHDLFANTKRVACYLANDGELDLMPLIHTLWKQEVETYLPVLHPFTKGHLLFIQYNKNTPMINNHFGIQEPKLNIQTMVKPDTLDCILVPLVAFDRKGNRLGMGGGFYDRTLAPVNEMNSDKPRLIGVAHEGQMATQLPYQGWDIPMQNILTPQQLFKPEI
jgi:5-formyltetrahydrofolate cyclo-ligase